MIEREAAAGSSRARNAAVLGSPIAHSLSPVLHTAAYTVLGLAWNYRALECTEAQLPGVLLGLDESFVGVSLTMPLKRAVVPLLDTVSELAQVVGAVNTVVFEGVGPFIRRRGENTDVPGMVAAIRGFRPDAVDSAVVLGAGGTAAAALAALRELGVGRPTVVVRDRGRAAELVAAAHRLGTEVVIADWPGRDVMSAADLVISTVPAGAADDFARGSPQVIGPGQLLFDVVYDPWPTPLAITAQAAGAQVVGGLELLVRQAALQVELMTGLVAPLDAMRAAGEAAIVSRSGRP